MDALSSFFSCCNKREEVDFTKNCQNVEEIKVCKYPFMKEFDELDKALALVKMEDKSVLKCLLKEIDDESNEGYIDEQKMERIIQEVTIDTCTGKIFKTSDNLVRFIELAYFECYDLNTSLLDSVKVKCLIIL